MSATCVEEARRILAYNETYWMGNPEDTRTLIEELLLEIDNLENEVLEAGEYD